MKPKPLTNEEQTQAKVLRADGRSVYAIAKDLQRSPHTIAAFLKRPETVEAVDAQKPQLARRYRELAESILNGVTAKDIEKANLTAKLIASGVAIDKALLLESGGAPIVANVQVLLQIAAVIRDRQDRPTRPLAIPLPEAQG